MPRNDRKSEIASQARNDSNIVSSRGTKRSRHFSADQNRKERLLRRLSCHRELIFMSSRAQRGDLGREVLTKMKERLLRASQ